MKRRRQKANIIAGIALGVVILGGGTVFATSGDHPFGTSLVGRQADGSVLTDVNQFVTPAGQQVEFGGNPISVKIRPDGKTAVVLNGRKDYGGNGLNIVDLSTGKLIDTNFTLPLTSMWGLTYSPDGNTLYASGSTGSTGKIVVMSVASDGTPTIQNTISLPNASVGGNIHPEDMAMSPDGKSLLVALNRDNSLGVVDPQSGQVTARIPVGNAPTSVMVVGNMAYVTNQGGRAAQTGDTTVDSSGTPVVVDPATGATSTGTVSVVDLNTNQVIQTVPVGVQPERMAVSGQYLFVTNTNSDTISVIDTTSNQVVQTIDVQPYPNAPKGSAPNAIAVMDGNKLVVSLGRYNALAVYDWSSPSQDPHLEGLLPTAWFPVDVALDSVNNRVLVANGDGVGSLGPARNLTIQGITVTGHSSYAQQGSLSMIPFPKTDDLVHGTDQVYADNNWFGVNQLNAPARNNKKPVPMPERIGEPSTIKHVFYIVKENRTYDQVLGDIGKGNSDPALTQFGQQVTPNLHLLANTFPLFDNFYTSGIQSASGHQWVMEGTNTDYEDKETDSDNVRSYPGGAGDAMAYAPTGHLWDDALKHGVSVVNFGEDTTGYSGSEPFGTWTDW